MKPIRTIPDVLPCHRKIKSLDELKHIIAVRRNHEASVAWTNGAFNTLHYGHVCCLEAIKFATGADIVIVGVNTDDSVVKNNKERNLIENEEARASRLGAMARVDYVTLVEDINMTRYISALRPDFYVKGGDYTIHTINQAERRLVESYGGKIVIIPKRVNVSTTGLFDKLRGERKNVKS